ncbi:MAG: tryptophan synthase, alpha subunit [Solirubrobacterales bacterium]|nr:tryptophan synthase, alpha subunit [Solirubrobacterales bacterium]
MSGFTESDHQRRRAAGEAGQVASEPLGEGAARIADAFATSGKRAALMPYLMGGFPSPERSLDIGLAYADGGADLVELGVPFSDPLADGPVVAAAGTAALRAGATVARVMEVCEGLAGRLPVVLMCYANLVLVRGPQVFAAALRDAGASGLIVPDLPMEEAPAVLAACDAAGIALVPLVAPTTPDERLHAIGARARGFLYTVSVTGTTGERAAPLGERVAQIVGRAKAATDVPVALGFGITTPEQASEAADAGADGVIVGSRLVREAAEAKDPAPAVRRVVAALAAALS